MNRHPYFQRRHYEAIASLFPSYNEGDRIKARMAERLADMFAADNPNFDRGRFLKACGVEG